MMLTRLLLSLGFVVGMLLAASPAMAHAHLASADPAAGSTMTAPPAMVTLTFTEALEPSFSSIQVKDAAGQRVDLDDAHIAADDAKLFSVGLKPLKAGVYTVFWRATSVDTHKSSGTYRFTVAP